MNTGRQYEGNELDIFAHAASWKRYWSMKLEPLLGESVLEVGAGNGTNTPYLCNDRRTRWLCIEPDPKLAGEIPGKLAGKSWAGVVDVHMGTMGDLPEDPVFDSIIYIDVLEHIEFDALEVQAAIRRLRPQGRLIILSPAYQFLFTEFDASIGHFRRYNGGSIRRLAPEGAMLEKLFYLDCAGLLASLGNKLLLHQSLPGLKQILFWDQWLVPVSRILDPLIGCRAGRSIIAVWRRT
jgi:SAM-dependent methyltransferase